MQSHQSRVNVRKLVSDLADMYPDSPFNVVLAELVANALDAKASNIDIRWSRDSRTLIVEDDGAGMDEAQFQEYHDFAAELKARGDGIGFAGVGAKISFNIADRVVTETQHRGISLASDWRWYSDGSLQWTSVESRRMNEDGTRVQVYFRPDQSLLEIDSDYLVRAVKRYYLPLFVRDFARSYAEIGLYSADLQFTVDGRRVSQQSLPELSALSKMDKFLTNTGWGVIGISAHERPIGGETYGILLCTHGKVVKPELFGLPTGSVGSKLFGIVEIPSLIKYLSTNKCDFRPGNHRGLAELTTPVRDRLKNFLAIHGGVLPTEQRHDQLTAKLERDLSKIIGRLPELQDFSGLLRKSRTLRRAANGDPTSPVDGNAKEPLGSESHHEEESTSQGGGTSRELDPAGKTRARPQRSRRNQGPQVAFEDQPARDETAWVESDIVVINSGHSAYRNRLTQDQARYTYCMFAIGIALDKAGLMANWDGRNYVDKFITAWGQS